MRKNVKDILIGDRFNNEVFCLKDIKVDAGSGASVIFSDKTGEIYGTISREKFISDYQEWVNNAVKINAIAVDGDGMKPSLIVKSMTLAEKSEYNANELFIGLSKEKVDEYIDMIKTSITRVQHEGFRQLLECALTDISLRKLAELPATLNRFGKYAGGALAEPAIVCEMCMRGCLAYVKYGNGLYTSGIDWSLLITGALLVSYGNIGYLTDMPWKRTAIGVQRGYMSVLQSSIEKLVLVNKIPLEDEDIARLLNILAASVSFKTEVKSTCKEGIVLRHFMHTYQELDMMDSGIAEYIENNTEEERDSYFYAKSIRSYVSV